MKNSPNILIVWAAILTSGSLFAQTVSLEIATGNFADVSGDPVPEGTLWGIVVDTTGAGFSGSVAQGGMTTLEPGSFLRDGAGNPTGAWFGGFYASQNSGPPPDSDPGWFGTAAGIPHVAGLGEARTGDQWGIIWFPNIQEGSIPYGTSQGYGFFTRSDLTIPSADSTETYSNFIPNDIKTADWFFIGQEGGPMYIIPEPSAYAAMLGLAILCFVSLKRQLSPGLKRAK